MSSLLLPSGSGRWIAGDGLPQNIGAKAIGLAQLPATWRPDHVVVGSDFLARPPAPLLKLATEILRELRSPTMLIVRSSAADEGLHARGKYVSRTVDANPRALAQTIDEVDKENRAICAAGRAPGSRACGLIVQPFLEPTAKGHLANEFRHAQRNVDFLYETEAAAVGSPLHAGPPRSFKLRRPLLKPRPSPLLLRRFEGGAVDAFKHVASWLASSLGRGHAEWVVHDDRLWLVQFDGEQDPGNIEPLGVWNEQAAQKFNGMLTAFRVLNTVGETDRWRKTRSHRVVALAGLPVPPIYILSEPSLIAELSANRLPDAVASDLDSLLRMPTMLRLDLDRSFSDWQNLPMCGPTRSRDVARGFMVTCLRDAAKRGVPASDAAIIVHHFIPARASAWASARPGSKHVQIDTNWGLPDGLQALPCDKLLVDLGTSHVERKIRYKDEFVDLESDGEWVSRRAPNKLARSCPLDVGSAVDVAKGTRAIAEVLQKPTSVMWFVDTDSRAQLGTSIAWIYVDEEANDFWSEEPERVRLAEQIRKKIDIGSARRLRTRKDLEEFIASPTAFDLGGRSVLFRPSVELLSDRTNFKNFLKEVAGALEQLPEWYLVLEGSVLSHAPYQLKSFGAKRIISLGEFVKPARRVQVRKLVRDKIPGSIEARGESAVSIALPRAELASALRTKLVEEALEVFDAPSQAATVQELADVLAVMQALAKQLGIDWKNVTKAEQEKRSARGGFERGLFLSATMANPGGQVAVGAPRAKEPVRRLRHRKGLAISLVPPSHADLRQQRLTYLLDGTRVRVEVRYEGAEVIVAFHVDDDFETPTQLSLFEAFKKGEST